MRGAARTVDDSTMHRLDAATPAAPAHTEVRPTAARGRSKRTDATSRNTQRNDASGSSPTSSASESMSPITTPPGQPSKPLSRHWRQPTNAREFAAQVNAVATMILNGEMNQDTARWYASVARTVVGAMSIEVTRARFLRTEPSLTLSDDIYEEGPEEP